MCHFLTAKVRNFKSGIGKKRARMQTDIKMGQLVEVKN
jgi:hypothetical protein